MTVTNITYVIKQHAVLICILISAVFILIASQLYPGGSLHDKNSIGFNWSKNFISNLFGEKAINGMDNPGRLWAIIGMAFHSVGDGIFFINMSKKIYDQHASVVLKIVGSANILFNFLIATSLHDMMVTVSSTLSLLGLFYITVFILKSKLNVLKFCCVTGMLFFYYTLYLYGAGGWQLLAVMQKISLIISMFLVLGLEYFTNQNDFKETIKQN